MTFYCYLASNWQASERKCIKKNTWIISFWYQIAKTHKIKFRVQNPSDIHCWEVTRSSRHFLSANEWDASLWTIGARWSSAPPVLCESRPSVCIHYALNSSQFSKTAWIQARKFWLLLVPLPLPFSETHTIIFCFFRSPVKTCSGKKRCSTAWEWESFGFGNRSHICVNMLLYFPLCTLCNGECCA